MFNGLIAYLEHAGRGTLPFLLPPVARGSGANLAMDAATRASLEILETQGGGRAGSLIATPSKRTGDDNWLPPSETTSSEKS